MAVVGAMAIPGLVKAVGGGMSKSPTPCLSILSHSYIDARTAVAGIQAAKLAKYAKNTAEEAIDAYSGCLSPCDKGGHVPKDMKKVFGVLNGVHDGLVPGKGG